MTNHETPDRRTQIRRVLAEADGFGFASLETHDYQRHADAILALFEPDLLRAQAEAHQYRTALEGVARKAAVSVPPPAPRADDRAAVCICGHTEAQHFEDACVTEVTGCDCGDFLTGEAAREVIARWRDAATRKADRADLPARLEAVLTERFTELGNPFSAMRRQEQGPDGWPASHPVGPHHVAEALRELLDGGPCVAGEQQNETPEAATVHAVPLPGSNGISSCCGRPPCEFVGERVTRDPDKVTCTGPTAGVRQNGTQP